jgi:aliphatic nitrilase
MGDRFPRYQAAAVQMAAVWMDREATTEKAVRLIQEASARGAKLIVLPEVIIPGTPHWIWKEPERYDYYAELFKNAVEIPSPTVTRLGEAARQADAYVVVGVHERTGKTLYNTMLFFDRDGQLLGKRRKLMGTFVEKTIWGMGGGMDLPVFATELGKLGGLICRENFSNLSRHALAAQGEEIHAAIWLAGSSRRGALFNRWIEASCTSHAVGSQTFVVACQACASETEMKLFDLKGPGGWSAIISPRGEVVAGPLEEGEGILVGSVDLEAALGSYPVWDEIGYHGRPDVFKVLINREPYTGAMGEIQPRREE